VTFLDASVLIAMAQVNHRHHAASGGLWGYCSAKDTTVSVDTLAEVYQVLTSLPPGLRLGPRGAVLAIETFLKRITAVGLTAHEQMEALRGAANLGIGGGAIYDVVQMAVVRKVEAQHIYTWNVERLQRAAPDLAERIGTP